MGITVTIACDAVEGVKCVDEASFSLILMDMQMPNKDGLEATEDIRNAGFTNLPIIALTANAFASDRDLCIDAGMNDFVTKPIDKRKLFEVIAKWHKQQSVTPTLQKNNDL